MFRPLSYILPVPVEITRCSSPIGYGPFCFPSDEKRADWIAMKLLQICRIGVYRWRGAYFESAFLVLGFLCRCLLTVNFFVVVAAIANIVDRHRCCCCWLAGWLAFLHSIHFLLRLNFIFDRRLVYNHDRFHRQDHYCFVFSWGLSRELKKKKGGRLPNENN